MRTRRSVAVILAVIAGAATAAVGKGQMDGPVAGGKAVSAKVTVPSPRTTPESSGPVSVPDSERTHPKVRPAIGRRLTDFTLTFTLREAPGHSGVFAVEYRVQIAPPRGAAASCVPTQPPPIESGAAGALEKVKLTPPAHGWCRGRHRATVFLQRGPYCPPPPAGQPPTPCPEFATQELDTGTAGFTVRPKAHV
jgi:hypothetical protein